MEVSHHTANDTSVEIDHCRACQVIWFDAGEMVSLAGPEPTATVNPQATRSAPEHIELLQAQARLTMKSSHHTRGFSEEPSDAGGLATIGAFLGFPVEDNAPVRRSVPFLSWGLGIAALVGGVWAFTNVDPTEGTAGFYGEAPLQGGGLPALLSLVQDTRPISVLLNVGVLFRLGDNVEDVLGHVGFAALCAIATAGAWTLHSLFLHSTGHPMVGITAAAAAIAVFYALRFPAVRLGWFRADTTYRWSMMSRRGLGSQQGSHPGDTAYWRWLLVDVRWAVLGWLVILLCSPWMAPEFSNSASEVLGGAATGGLAYLGFGRGMLHHPDEEPPV